MTALADCIDALDHAATLELRGTIAQVKGLALIVQDMPAPVGATVRIESSRGRRCMRGEVIGFNQDQTVVMPLGGTDGVCRGDAVVAEQFERFARVGSALLGRVLNANGEAIDGKGPMANLALRPLCPPPVDPMDRPVIDAPLAVGVRAIDGLHSIGRGQRLGIFAAPGLGKSTLLGMMARHTDADVAVIGLVGERGREVRDFIENQLGEQGLARSVVVCATSDEPPLTRIRSAMLANAIAEHFRDMGKDVLLMMDSITRFCQAQRQVGLAAGEPPTTKGYPPSVFAALPSLLERSGRTSCGSITGLYSILVEGDEVMDPVADAARGILDGHIQLSAHYATRGHWPAIDPVTSISRVAENVTDTQHNACASLIKQVISSYKEVEDLVNIGAYAAGSNSAFDLAIACKDSIDSFLRQGRNEVKQRADFEQTNKMVIALANLIQQEQMKLRRPPRGRPATGPGSPRTTGR